jgi:hypothetical protein
MWAEVDRGGCCAAPFHPNLHMCTIKANMFVPVRLTLLRAVNKKKETVRRVVSCT